VVDRYRVTRLLGRGGFGSVYAAVHEVVGQPVALKILDRNRIDQAQSLERFFREARAAGQIGHPNIVRVLDAGTAEGGVPFIAMDLVDGVALSSIPAGELDVARVVRIGVEVLRALEAAHQAGIVHRDVKPANVMVGRGPEGDDRVWVLDFGISKIANPDATSLTQPGMMIGTPGYAAPEQYTSPRSIDERVDLYGVGALMYRMLSGRLPHSQPSPAETMLAACARPPAPLASVAPVVPEALAAVVDRSLATHRSDRWPTASAMREALEAALSRTAGDERRARPNPAAREAAPTRDERAPRTPAEPSAPLEPTALGPRDGETAPTGGPDLPPTRPMTMPQREGSTSAPPRVSEEERGPGPSGRPRRGRLLPVASVGIGAATLVAGGVWLVLSLAGASTGAGSSEPTVAEMGSGGGDAGARTPSGRAADDRSDGAPADAAAAAPAPRRDAGGGRRMAGRDRTGRGGSARDRDERSDRTAPDPSASQDSARVGQCLVECNTELQECTARVRRQGLGPRDDMACRRRNGECHRTCRAASPSAL